MQLLSYCYVTLHRKRKPSFRPMFKLVFAPNQAPCGNEWGYNTDGWHMQAANEVAKQVAQTARSQGGYITVTWRLCGGYTAVT